MTDKIEEHMGKLVACYWCGNVRDKKVRVAGSDGTKIVVCRKHFEHKDGSLVNNPTVEAIVRLWCRT